MLYVCISIVFQCLTRAERRRVKTEAPVWNMARPTTAHAQSIIMKKNVLVGHVDICCK